MDKNNEKKTPTESFVHNGTRVNVYGKLDIQQLAKSVYNIKIKYNL